MTDCPFKSDRLEVLPKGSACQDWKQVPAISSYWRPETESVERCAKYSTGKRKEPPKKEGGGDGVGAYDRVDPDSVDEKLDSTWPVVYVLEYSGSVPEKYDGSVYIFVVDSGEDSRTSRYLAKIKGDDVSLRTIGRSDDLDEAKESVREYARGHDPTTPMPEFDVVIPNSIMKPVANAAHRFGTGTRIEITDADAPANDFRVMRFVGGGGLSMYVAQIPTSKIENKLGPDGAASVSMDRISKVLRDTPKSDSVRLYTDDGRLRVRGDSAGSGELSHAMNQQIQPPKGGASDAMVTTSGRNYRRAVRAIDTLAIRDADPVAVVVDDDDARLVGETDYQYGEERIRAPLNLVDDEPYEESGEATIGVRFGHVDDSSRVIPRPASTATNLYLYEGGDRPHLTVEYTDEGARFTHYIAANEDIGDYDLSSPSALKSVHMDDLHTNNCPKHEETSTVLCESSLLTPGTAVPDWKGTAHTGETVSQPDESVVWFFPNTGGCRCSQQAMQFEQLQSELGTPVYGITNNDADELASMAESFGLSNITLVSDPDGEIAEKFGVPIEGGGPQRSLFFVRNGEIIESVDGMAAVEVQQTELNEADDVAEIAQKLSHPSVAVITGARGKGKSSLAYHLAEEMSKRDGTIPVTIGLPPDKVKELPDRWMSVESLEAAPHQAVIVVDEAYAKYHAREAMKNVGMAEIVNQSRHCSRSILFVTQNSGHLDKTGVSEADAIFMKEPGPFHMRFERAGVRDMTEEAKSAFDQLPGSMNEKAYTYVFSDDFQGMVETEEADFYGDALSKSYSGACVNSDTGTENLSQPVPCLDDLDTGTPAFAFGHGDGSNLDRLN